MARLTAAQSFNFDTFDAQHSGEPSVVEVLGRTHSRLVTWTDFPGARITGDLARSWEQPDPSTWVFHLDPAARWHDRAPLNGRAVAAGDVVQHVERMRALSRAQKLPLVQRASDSAGIRRVSSTGAGTVVIETERPDPFLLDALAGRLALVQAPEAVSAFGASWHERRPEQLVGSGPFILAATGNGVLAFRAHRAGHRPPFLDAVEVRQPSRDMNPFLQQQVDEVLTRDRRDADAVREKAGGTALELARFEDSPVISTFFAGTPPWNNPELVRAISGALNRGKLAARLFGGRAVVAGLISPATPAFALSERDLAGYLGYRSDAVGDASAARALWQAAGGPGLGTVTIDFPSIFDPLYAASAVVTGMLNEVLGPQFRPAVETYTTISAKTLERRYGNGHAALWFGWAPPLSSPEPSRWLIETFRDGSPTAESLGVRAFASGELHRLESEFDPAARARLAGDVQRAHLDAGSPGLLTWALQRGELFRWPRLHGSVPTPFWNQHLDAESSVES